MKAAAALAAALLVVGCCAELLGWKGFLAKFRLDGELNFAAWYSSSLILAGAATAFRNAATDRSIGARTASGWMLLGVLLVYASADEVVGVHENFGQLTGGLPFAEWLSYFSWVLIGGPLAVLAGLVLLPFLLRLPRTTAVRLVIAGSIFVLGAVVFEIIGAYAHLSAGGRRTVLYILFITVEEALEYTGILLAIRAMLRYAAELRPAQPLAISAANASNSG